MSINLLYKESDNMLELEENLKQLKELQKILHELGESL